MAAPTFYSNWPTLHQRHHTTTVSPPPDLSPFNDHFTLSDSCINNSTFNNGFITNNNNNNLHFHNPISYPTLSSSYNPLATQQQLVPASLLPDLTQSFGFGHEYYSNSMVTDVCDDGEFFFMDPVEPMQLCSQTDYYSYQSYPIHTDVCPMEEMPPELLPTMPEIYNDGGSSTMLPSYNSALEFNATQGEDKCVQMKENGNERGRVSAQSMAARVRRRKISEKTSELGKLVPGGHRMTTAEMFQAAFKYIKFLQAQVNVLEQMPSSPGLGEELQALLTCPTVQEKLYAAGKCIVSQTLGEALTEDHQGTNN